MDSSTEVWEEDDSPFELTTDLLDKARNALLEAKRLIPLNEDAFAEFEARHQDVLCTKNSPLIDLLVRSGDWTPDETMNFCNKLIPRHSKLLLYRNGDDWRIPLHTALSRKNHCFVQAVLEMLGDTDRLPEILEETTPDQENCLHLAIRHSSPWTAKMILALASSGKLRKILRQPNARDRTPLDLVIFKANPPEMPRVYDADQNSHFREPSVFHSALQKKKRHAGMRKEPASVEPIPATHAVFSTEQILRLLIKHGGKDLLVFEDSEGRTPYQQRLQILHNALQKHYHYAVTAICILGNPFRELVMKDKVASYIMSYCISNLSSADIFRALHTRERLDQGNFRTFESELNLTTLKTAISGTYLDELGRSCSFEPILKSVTLPKLTLEENPTAQAKQAGESMAPAGKRVATLAVFDWLRDQQVRRIIEVNIDDDTEPSSTNAAIEASLKGFEIQRLQWKRTDIPCDVFCNSTSALRYISLYWSGDKAVLDGWSGPDGFSNARKFPEIRAIAVYFKEVPGRQMHILEHLLQCKEKLEWSCRNSNREINITVYHPLGIATDHDPRFETISPFTSFIGTIPDNIVAPTSIALISDGVDPTSETLRGKIYRIVPEADVMSAKFGTTSARFITQTCPKLRLLIFKAKEEKSGSHNGRHLSPSLAAKAIMLALHRDVDIICIGLSIDVGETRGVIDLAKAIANADDKGIPVFCPAIPSTGRYPAEFYRCVRIAAATPSGELPARTESYDFLLPGEGIPLLDSEGFPSSYESGNQVATAIAAGLAGILVFCHRLTDSGASNDHRCLPYIEAAFRGLRLDFGNFVLPDTLIEGLQAKGLSWETHEEEMKGMISNLIETITMRGRL